MEMNKDSIIIQGLQQNNLKNISLTIPKNKIVVFTGVSGSGKSSIVFDTIAAESQRQMNETYSAFIRGRLPKYEKPKVELIDHLNAAVIIDQSRLGGNARSTVGTISDLYTSLRLLYSRIGVPHIPTASSFSFNDPSGMCPECSGLGKVVELKLEAVLDEEKSWNEGMVDLPGYHPEKWYFKQYVESGLFDPDKKLKDYTDEERNLLYYGALNKDGERVNQRIEGIYNHWNRILLNRESASSEPALKRMEALLKKRECPRCHGLRLNDTVLACRINGKNIAELCSLELTQLREFLSTITEERAQTIVEALKASLTRMIDIGLPYLSLNRESSTLSGGEAQRLKLVRYMGSSLTGMMYIFDEPSTGMHPRDVFRMNQLLQRLRDRGNTVLVVEHDKDVIKIADEVIDVGPAAGRNGGHILFQGSYEQLLLTNTLTANALKQEIELKQNPRRIEDFLPIRHASLHNLKDVSVDIPMHALTVITGVAGSGKSTLIRDVFANVYSDQVILVDQSAVTAKGRSTPVTYLGFFDEIRKILAKSCGVDASLFSFNSKGACPTCKGKGIVVTELVFMEPVTTVCEQCDGKRFSKETQSIYYKGKNIVDILAMTADEALSFFKDYPKIKKHLKAMNEVGLSYLTLGQPLSTLSGGERQRIKLAKYLNQKGNIYVLDEPTTGLHAADVKKMLTLLDSLVIKGNSVIVIEHNLDVMKQADYLIDVGPDGGSAGGQIVFTGTPQEMIDKGKTITAQYLKRSLNK